MVTGLRDDTSRWIIGIAASGMLLLIMGWSATQPTLHYSLAASCTGYGNSQSDCQAQAGATGAVQAAATGMPNTGQQDLLKDVLIGMDLVLLGGIMLLAIRRRRGRAPAP
jgi:LPXTG-motif cell wall-anchored protein